MKRCPQCGKEYPDDVVACTEDATHLSPIEQMQTPGDATCYVISPEEHHYWERMTFRQFAILMVRLQSVWLVFNALVEATYLPRLFVRLNDAQSSSYSSAYSSVANGLKSELYLMLLRVIMHLTAAFLVFHYAERVLSWLVKDHVVTRPSEK